MFERREVEKLGKMFMFRWAEVLFAIYITTIFASIANSIITYEIVTISNFVIVTIFTIAIYMLINILFTTGFKKDKIKENIKVVTILIPIGISIATYLFFILNFMICLVK